MLLQILDIVSEERGKDVEAKEVEQETPMVEQAEMPDIPEMDFVQIKGAKAVQTELDHEFVQYQPQEAEDLYTAVVELADEPSNSKKDGED